MNALMAVAAAISTVPSKIVREVAKSHPHPNRDRCSIVPGCCCHQPRFVFGERIQWLPMETSSEPHLPHDRSVVRYLWRSRFSVC